MKLTEIVKNDLKTEVFCQLQPWTKYFGKKERNEAKMNKTTKL